MVFYAKSTSTVISGREYRTNVKTSNQPQTGNEVFKIMNELNKRFIETKTETDRVRDRQTDRVIVSTFGVAHIYNIQPSHVAYSGR